MKLLFEILAFHKKYKEDKVALYAAQSSFFIIVSFFPFLMLLLSILQYTSIRESYLLSLVNSTLPLKIQPLIITLISEIYASSSVTLTSITAISAIWAAGKGFVSLIRGLNNIYGTESRARNFFMLRIYSILYTLGLILIICIALSVIIFGNHILIFIKNNWPLLGSLISYILKFRLLLLICALTLFFLIVYTYIPNRKTSFEIELPGAVFASLGWIIFSYAFTIYIEFSGSLNAIYGSLSTLVIIMLWLYICINILFIGAVLNASACDKAS